LPFLSPFMPKTRSTFTKSSPFIVISLLKQNMLP
jgi:hypothetical protein